MRTHLTRTILALLALAAQACSKSDNTRVKSQAGGEATVSPSTDSAKAHNEALVRVVNAIPGSGAIDVYAGDQQKFTKVEFKNATPYETLTENTPNFKVVRAGAPDSTPLATEMAIARDGHFYTIVALGAVGSPDSADHKVALDVMRDDLVPGDSTKARIRVFNAASGSGDLDVFVEGQKDKDPLFNDVDVKDDDGFKDVAPGKMTLIVRPNDNANTLLRMPVELKAGQSLTLVLAHPTPTSKGIVGIKITDEAKPASRMPKSGN
jgi:uncharacterized protein DUF4397